MVNMNSGINTNNVSNEDVHMSMQTCKTISTFAVATNNNWAGKCSYWDARGCAIDNDKLVEYYVEYYYEFEGLETFTGFVKDKNGNIAYYVKGEYHRDNGPAIECYNGDKEWLSNGKTHRKDGPAFESVVNNLKEWWFNGTLYGKNDDYTNDSWIAFVETLK